jgi:predicted ester cyclase
VDLDGQALDGEYMGLPPTGKAVTYTGIFIVRFSNGRIAEMWGVFDLPSQTRQLGAIHAEQPDQSLP